MAVGRARMDGVEVHGNSSLLGMSGFEAYAKSTAHRPAQFTFVSSGQSLQVCLFTAVHRGSSLLGVSRVQAYTEEHRVHRLALITLTSMA